VSGQLIEGGENYVFIFSIYWPLHLGAPCSLSSLVRLVPPRSDSRSDREVNIRDYHSGENLLVVPSNEIAGGRLLATP